MHVMGGEGREGEGEGRRVNRSVREVEETIGTRGALNFQYGASVRPEGSNKGACEWTTAEFGTLVN